jgi:hypothetical protein
MKEIRRDLPWVLGMPVGVKQEQVVGMLHMMTLG